MVIVHELYLTSRTSHVGDNDPIAGEEKQVIAMLTALVGFARKAGSCTFLSITIVTTTEVSLAIFNISNSAHMFNFKTCCCNADIGAGLVKRVHWVTVLMTASNRGFEQLH